MNPSHSECALELLDSPHRRHEVSRSSRVFLYDVVTHPEAFPSPSFQIPTFRPQFFLEIFRRLTTLGLSALQYFEKSTFHL